MERLSSKELMELRKTHVPVGPFNTTPLFVTRARGAMHEHHLRHVLTAGPGRG